MSAARQPDEAKRCHRGRSIWWIVSAPAVWAAHFLASYLTAAIFCAKFADSDQSAGEVQLAVMGYTVIALIVLAGLGSVGFRRHRSGNGSAPHDEASRADQRRMIGMSTFLLSLLSAVATIFTALVVYFVGSCH